MSAVAPYRNPLDVLWRAVPTPFRGELRLADRHIAIETNDPELLAKLTTPAALEGMAQPNESDFLWRIVRDEEAPSSLEPYVGFEEAPLSFVAMGSSLAVAVDHERNELIAFVGEAISHAEFAATTLPLFEKLTLGGRGALDPAAHHNAPDAISSNDAGH